MYFRLFKKRSLKLPVYPLAQMLMLETRGYSTRNALENFELPAGLDELEYPLQAFVWAFYFHYACDRLADCFLYVLCNLW